MATLGSILDQAFDLVSVSEKLRALSWLVANSHEALLRTVEAAPELAPELAAAEQRLVEAAEHLEAAAAVLAARLEILRDEVKGAKT